MKVSVIIPMYNEEKIIKDTAMTLSKYMEGAFESYEILFSDDGSTDRSVNIVKELGLPSVSVITQERNRGKGHAVRKAILESNGDVIIFTDADLAYGVEYVKDAVTHMSKDRTTDILIGSRNLSKDGYKGYTFLRRLMSKTYIKILCLAGGFKLSDSQCGFKAFKGDVARQIFSECEVDGFAFDFEVILRALKYGKIIKEMPVKVINHRNSSVRPLKDSLKMLKDIRIIKRRVDRGV